MDKQELLANPLLTIAFLSKLLNLSAESIRTRLRKRDVVSFRVGPGERSIRVPASEINKLAKPGSGLNGMTFMEFLQASTTKEEKNA